MVGRNSAGQVSEAAGGCEGRVGQLRVGGVGTVPGGGLGVESGVLRVWVGKQERVARAMAMSKRSRCPGPCRVTLDLASAMLCWGV